MSRRILALIAWSGALIATFAAALVMPNVMGIAGIVAAVAALAWGLLTAIDRACQREYRAAVWQRRDEEAELPYVPINEGAIVFDHEDAEWRRGVADMSEFEREVAGDSHRAALGVTGDREDERYG